LNLSLGADFAYFKTGRIGFFLGSDLKSIAIGKMTSRTKFEFYELKREITLKKE
jgi:hypothetical protein